MGRILSPVLVRLDRADFYKTPMIAHWCPGCDSLHGFSCEKPQANALQWHWNGNAIAPTFKPRMYMKFGPWGASNEINICHYILEDGVIDYMSDCTHVLRATRVPLPVIPEDRLMRIRMNQSARDRAEEMQYGT